MERLWDTGEGVVSTQVLQEFYVTVTAKIPNPLKPREARQIISDLGTWTVAVLETRDILAGSEMAERYRLVSGTDLFWLPPIKKRLQPFGPRISAMGKSTAKSQFVTRC